MAVGSSVDTCSDLEVSVVVTSYDITEDIVSICVDSECDPGVDAVESAEGAIKSDKT